MRRLLACVLITASSNLSVTFAKSEIKMEYPKAITYVEAGAIFENSILLYGYDSSSHDRNVEKKDVFLLDNTLKIIWHSNMLGRLLSVQKVGNAFLGLCRLNGRILLERLDIVNGKLIDTISLFKNSSCLFLDTNRILFAHGPSDQGMLEIYNISNRKSILVENYKGNRYLFKNALTMKNGFVFGYRQCLEGDKCAYYSAAVSNDKAEKNIKIIAMNNGLEKSELPSPIFFNQKLYFVDVPYITETKKHQNPPNFEIYATGIGGNWEGSQKIAEYSNDYELIDLNYEKYLAVDNTKKKLRLSFLQ